MAYRLASTADAWAPGSKSRCMLFLVLAGAAAASVPAGSLQAAPSALWIDCRGPACGGPLVCPAGYTLDCEELCRDCDLLHEHYETRERRYGGCGGSVQYVCCTCWTSTPLPPSVKPTTTGNRTCADGTCSVGLSCPSGQDLSDPRHICTRGAPCSVLGPTYVESQATAEVLCDSDYWEPLTDRACATCQPALPSVPEATTSRDHSNTSSTTTTTATRATTSRDHSSTSSTTTTTATRATTSPDHPSTSSPPTTTTTQALPRRCLGEVPRFAGVDAPPQCEELLHGQRCSLGCASGYALSGSTGLVCNGSRLALDGAEPPRCEPASCAGSPTAFRGGNHSSCAGAAHGSNCTPRCMEGHTMPSGNITCRLGQWRVTGICWPEITPGTGVPPTRNASGASMQLDVVVDAAAQQRAIEQGVEVFNSSWALRNKQVLLEAVAGLVRTDPGRVQLEVVALQGTRRLQDTASSSASSFRLRLLFQSGEFLQGANNTGVLQEFEHRLTGSNATSSPGLLAAVGATLAAKGLPAPEGLSTASVRSSGEPVFIEDLALPVPQWLARPWGDCDCGAPGGAGLQRRTVLCTVDHLESCGTAQAMPEAERACQCPTPLPESSSGTAWAASVSVIAALACMCCGLGCAYEMRRYLSAEHQHGRRSLPNSNVAVSYVVQSPQGEGTPDGKVHVIWDLEEDHMRRFSSRWPAAEPPGEEATARTLEAPEVLSPGRPSEGDRRQALESACPAYRDRAQVDYFSRTHRRWLPGVLRLQTSVLSDGRALASYDVCVGLRQQWRLDVPLDRIRLSLEEGEPVELFSTRWGGAWLPAVLSGPQTRMATLLGYTAQLERPREVSNLEAQFELAAEAADLEEILARRRSVMELEGRVVKGIPATRIRRSFPEGCYVAVYRGPPRGWVPAVVARRQDRPSAAARPQDGDGAAADEERRLDAPPQDGDAAAVDEESSESSSGSSSREGTAAAAGEERGELWPSEAPRRPLGGHGVTELSPRRPPEGHGVSELSPRTHYSGDTASCNIPASGEAGEGASPRTWQSELSGTGAHSQPLVDYRLTELSPRSYGGGGGEGLGLGASHSLSGEREHHCAPWVLVPIVEISEGTAGGSCEAEEVASYLLRRMDVAGI
uniref:Sushi domain-containing protein n=1 Tax=Alexandrium monilatum TaxID=311494 RepID=A0A7S4S7G7_9DINO